MRRRDDRGAATLEAGLLAAGVAAALIAVLTVTGGGVQAMFQTWIDAVAGTLG